MGYKKMISMINPRTIEYFKEYPAPLMEKIFDGHLGDLNSTITFFGPMFYFFARAIGAGKVLEIGHAEGYSSYYFAHAVKDNGTRYGLKDNMYYGIDIIHKDWMKEAFKERDLPVTIITMDSMKLTPETFKDIKFDIIFQDGHHDTEHVLYEMETMYPQLKGNGEGYWLFHDCYGPAEEGFRKLEELIKAGKYKFEWCRIFCAYGLAILRKMDDFDYNKRFWV